MLDQQIPKTYFISRVEFPLRDLAVVNWNLGQCLAYRRDFVFCFFLNFGMYFLIKKISAFGYGSNKDSTLEVLTISI